MTCGQWKEPRIGHHHPAGHRTDERFPDERPGNHDKALVVEPGRPLTDSFICIGSSMHASLCAMVD
jgi:hypothetical protein